MKQHAFFEGVIWELIGCATTPEIPKPVDFKCIPAPLTSSTEKNGTVAAAPDKKKKFQYIIIWSLISSREINIDYINQFMLRVSTMWTFKNCGVPYSWMV